MLPEIKSNEINWDFANRLAALKNELSKYDNLVVTDDNLKDMKSTQRDLASMRIKIDKFRKATKKSYQEPLASFENEVKEFIKVITDHEEPIKEQLEKYEQQRIAKASAEVEKIKKEYAAEIGLREEFLFKFAMDSKWLNVNITKKARYEGITKAIDLLMEQQVLCDEREKMYQMRKEQIEMYCDNFSEKYSLNTPITLNDVASYTKGLELIELKPAIESVAKKRAEIEFKMMEQVNPVEEPPKEEPKEEVKPVEVKQNDVLFNSTIVCNKISQAQLNQVLTVLENMNIEFTHKEGM